MSDIDTPSNDSKYNLLRLCEDKPMKKLFTISTLILSTFAGSTLANDREAKQQKLNEACEAARLELLKPIREKYAAQCVEERNESQEYCDRFYSTYGNQGGGQTPLFYDIPECEKAWDYLNSYRRPD